MNPLAPLPAPSCKALTGIAATLVLLPLRLRSYFEIIEEKKGDVSLCIKTRDPPNHGVDLFLTGASRHSPTMATLRPVPISAIASQAKDEAFKSPAFPTSRSPLPTRLLCGGDRDSGNRHRRGGVLSGELLYILGNFHDFSPRPLVPHQALC